MISQHVQSAWSGVVCNQIELTGEQNVIPYGETERDNIVIVGSNG